MPRLHLLFRPRAIAIGALVAAFSSCASDPLTREFVRLDIAAFNATGTSWRALESRKDYRRAARLIAAYLAAHANALSEHDLTLLHFHAAQEFAFAGDYARALPHLPKSRHAQEPDSFPLRWNDYVAATEAFLKRDRAALLRARERIAAGPTWNGEILNLNIVDSLLDHFDEPYVAAYAKAPRPPPKP